jgi:membrane complex biogenesis BtpA family protein
VTAARRLPPRGAGRAQLIGCLHLLPLPGSPGWGGRLAPVLDRALAELDIYRAAGVGGVLIENTWDIPYQKRHVDAGTVAALAVVAAEVRRRYPGPIGVQVLAGANLAALDVAVTCDLDVLRVEGFAYAHVADEGLIEADAAALMRRRAHLGAGHIEVWADIKKKHASHALTGDLSIRDVADGVAYFGADGVVVTGALTGKPAATADLDALAGLPLRRVVGSGVTAANLADYARRADALIVGSDFKTDGDWKGDVEPARVQALVAALRAL